MDVRVKIDEREFEGVVREHAGWLFGAAVRQLGDRGMAEDAVQVVFILLARRASVMKERDRVAGWLFKTLGFTVKNFRRVEGRRRRREREARVEMRGGKIQMRDELGEMVGRLDEAVGKLPEKYREAILLRFYREVGFEELAKRWGVKEAGARKRVERGLEMLRERLGGEVSAGVVSACVVMGMGEMPVGLVKSVVSGVVGGKGAVAASVLTAAKGVNAMMMAAKVKMAAGVLAVVMMLPVGVGVVRLVMGEGVVTSAPASGFTISKETTGVMGPLRADGTVDYVAALNERYGKGVTPENNAFVGWLEVEGVRGSTLPVKVREKMVEMSGAKLTGEEKPFLEYGKFLAMKGVLSTDPDFATRVAEANVKGVWKAEEHPLVAEWLEGQKGFLDSMSAVWARPRYWEPAVSGDGRSAIGVMTQTYEQIGGVGDALATRAGLRFGSGDLDGFMADVVTMGRMSRRLAMGESIIQKATGYGMLRGDSELIAVVAGSGRLSAEQCARLSKELDGREPMTRLDDAMDFFERWWRLDMAMLVATGKLDVMKNWESFGKFAAIDRGAVNWDVVMRRFNAASDDAVEGMKAKDLRVMQRVTELALNQQTASLDFEKREGESGEVYTDRVAAGMLRVFCFSSMGAEEFTRKNLMREEMARMVVAAAAYKAEKGKWPGTLEELVPGYVGRVPADIYSREEGGAVKYVVGEKGVRVYSVGRNGVDDGGVWDSKVKRDDVVVGVGE